MADHEDLSEDDVHAMFERPSWEERYAAPDSIWSGNPNPQLVAEAHGRAPGTALDLGCGEGADAVWLAQQGWQVTGVDFSQAGLDRAAAAAGRAGVADHTAWERADVRAWRPAATYDLITTQFLHLLDGGMVQLVPRLADALNPGGLLLVVGHHPDDQHSVLRHAAPAGVMFTPDDLLPALDADRFDVVGAVRERVQMRDGEAHTVHDSVVMATRRPSAAL